MLSLKAIDLNLNFKLETSMEAKLILLVTQKYLKIDFMRIELLWLHV